MTTLDTAYPTPHRGRELGTLLRLARSLNSARGLGSLRARADDYHRSVDRAPTRAAKSAPRWTRETENPFDVPTSTYREAIP